MKKLFATAAFALFVGLTSFAADIKVNQRVQAAFEKEFTTATNVSWEVLKEADDIYHANFTYASEIMEAYFTVDGTLIAAARHISPDKLPLLVSKSLRENFSHSTIRQISEYMSPETTSYIVSLDNEKASMLVRIYHNGNSEVLKKTKK